MMSSELLDDKEGEFVEIKLLKDEVKGLGGCGYHLGGLVITDNNIITLQ